MSRRFRKNIEDLPRCFLNRKLCLIFTKITRQSHQISELHLVSLAIGLAVCTYACSHTVRRCHGLRPWTSLPRQDHRTTSSTMNWSLLPSSNNTSPSMPLEPTPEETGTAEALLQEAGSQVVKRKAESKEELREGRPGRLLLPRRPVRLATFPSHHTANAGSLRILPATRPSQLLSEGIVAARAGLSR